MNKKLTIGLFGFGVVGQGLNDIIRTKDLNLEIKRIAIKHPEKQRTLPKELFTTNADDILNDPELNTIVELINDTEAAFVIVSRALSSGKNVVSASKKMIALHLQELIELQDKYGTSLLYEGSVCGSIPIVRNLEEYYYNELLYSVQGIFNDSSNFILSKILNENISYYKALKQAQELGFAETDPLSDVGGFDSKYKLLIVALHAYGIVTKEEKIPNIGIQHISNSDIQYAREKNYKIKLVPNVIEFGEKEIVLYVMPRFIKPDDFLYSVENEYNGVVVQAAFADQQFFFGKGAGGHPTGSAVLSDIAALRYEYKYEYKKYRSGTSFVQSYNNVLTVYLRYEDDLLIEKLNFESISQRFYAEEFKYIIGEIKLSELIKNKKDIDKKGVFLAEL